MWLQAATPFRQPLGPQRWVNVCRSTSGNVGTRVILPSSALRGGRWISNTGSTSNDEDSSSHPSHTPSGVKSTLPSSSQPINLHHAFEKLQREQKDNINDGDRGYLAFTKASLFKLTLPLYPPDSSDSPTSPTSKASSAYSKSVLIKSTSDAQDHNAESDDDTGPISAEPWESRVDKGAKISQVESTDNTQHVKRRGKSGSTKEDVANLHGPEQGEPADDEGMEFDAKAPAKSVVFLLHSGQPLSYIASLIQAERPGLTANDSPDSKHKSLSQGTELYDPTITFHTRVGDGKRWSSATGIGDFLRDAARIGSFVVKVGKEREIRVSVPSFEDRTRFLRGSLYGKTAQIARMAKLKGECDTLAHHGTRRFAVAGAGILGVWWVFVTYATFFTSLGWDVMEPATYLVGLGTLMAGYSWFLVHNREVSYRTVLNETTTKRQQRLYNEKGFNVERFQELIDEAKQLRKAIKLVAEDYDLEWDQGDTESGKQHKKALDVVRKAEAREESASTSKKKDKENEEEDEEDEGDEDGEHVKDEDGDGRPDGQQQTGYKTGGKGKVTV
ncbi:unnamed protein product [Sympodiomycopsis kandeliae]